MINILTLHLEVTEYPFMKTCYTKIVSSWKLHYLRKLEVLLLTHCYIAQ